MQQRTDKKEWLTNTLTIHFPQTRIVHQDIKDKTPYLRADKHTILSLQFNKQKSTTSDSRQEKPSKCDIIFISFNYATNRSIHKLIKSVTFNISLFTK